MSILSTRVFILIVLLLALPSTGESRRNQSLENAPVPISVVTGDEIESLGLADVTSLTNQISVMPFRGGPAGQPSNAINIRGVGGLSGQQHYSGAGYYVDGIYIGDGGQAGYPAMFDLERIEVLKGPQGTLYGREAIAGVVQKIIRPGGETSFSNAINFGSDDSGQSSTSDFDYIFNDPDRPGLYDNYYTDALTRGMLTGDLSLPSLHYYKWNQAFSELTFDDMLFAEKGANQPNQLSQFWINESNRWVEKKQAGYPNDPLYPKKGSKGKTSGARKTFGSLLKVIGSPIAVSTDESSAQWGLPEAGFHPTGENKSAWDIAAGDQENVVVAVIDSGLDLTHVDGPQYTWTNTDEIANNGIDDDQNGYVDDVHGWNFYDETNDITDNNGHGTFVAGIISAKINNGEGIAGINPGARIMPLKVLNQEGKSRILAVYRAIRYAVDNGARILNLSIGGKGITRLEQIGINYAYAMGCIVVVASGNEGSDIALHGPPGARRAFSVAAIDMDGKPRESSNWGINVAITAPGQSIYSLTAKKGNRDGKFMPLTVGKYFRASGTSFSAPFVTGTASLIWSKHPNLTNRMVEDMILQSAKDIHDQGWDPHTGYGLLDAHGALTQNPNGLLIPRITEVYINKIKRTIASVDLYGVIRGNLDHYMVHVGRGKKPSKWQTIYGPVTTAVDYQLISRIDGSYFSKGSLWTIKVDAVDKNQQTKSISLLISKETT